MSITADGRPALTKRFLLGIFSDRKVVNKAKSAQQVAFNFNIANMSCNFIRENTILANIFECTIKIFITLQTSVPLNMIHSLSKVNVVYSMI